VILSEFFQSNRGIHPVCDSAHEQCQLRTTPQRPFNRAPIVHADVELQPLDRLVAQAVATEEEARNVRKQRSDLGRSIRTTDPEGSEVFPRSEEVRHVLHREVACCEG